MSENSAAKQRLLIVDDSKVIRVTARKILQNQFETVEAVDGENAWQILTGMGPFSLVISDLTMPKLDGFGLLEKIRTAHDPHISNLPVIVITGDNDSESTMQRAREAGATDFIGKPFDSVHLLARAHSHASAHAEKQSLTEQNIALEDQSLIDAQTGLANENAFIERGHELLSYARRHNTTLTVAQIEIDNYGDLLQQHGDPITEMVVKYVANVLVSGIREEDMAARIGPARFAMLLTGMERNGVQALSDRISRDIRERIIRYGSEEISFTASIGICAPDIETDTGFEDLLRIAGNNLQRAIAGYGNRTIFDNDTAASPPPAEDITAEETVADNIPDQPIDENVSPMALEEIDTGETVTAMDEVSVMEILATTVAQPATHTETGVPETALQISLPEAETEAEAETGVAETAPEEQLPEMFAEPVTGVSNKLASRVAQAKQLAAADEEEIIITAPFGGFNDMSATDSQQEQGDTSATAWALESTTDHQQATQFAATAEAESPTATPAAVIPDDTGAPRQGFFSRIFAIFKRSK